MHLRDERVARVSGAEHVACGCFQVPLIDLFDRHDREDLVACVEQCDVAV